METTRRDFLRLGAFGLLTPYVLFGKGSVVHSFLTSKSSASTLDSQQWFDFDPQNPPESVFGISVASGDPTSSGVIIWTRINSELWTAGQQLAFEVAEDENFQNITARGLVDSADFSPARDCTVKLDLDGQLASNRFYYYRFIYNRTASRTGRCRTLPTANENLDQVRFGVITCQDYTNGYYAAFHHLAAEDIDFVIHLGDFIYETAGDPRFQSLPFPDRTMILPSGGTVSLGLEDYRFIYRTYRSDKFLQQAMERHTWIMIWDDHETCNDCYWDYDRDCLGAPDHPYTTDAQYGNNPALLNQLKRDSQRAWLEYVPARISANESATSPQDVMKIYRQFRFGNLAELFMTDERTYRSPHPCGELSQTGGIGGREISAGCPAQLDSQRFILGQTQRDWFLNGVIGSSALWKVWGNEVIAAPLKIGAGYFDLDGWDGYQAERSLIMKRLLSSFVNNFIALTGDLHTYMASYLKADFNIPQNTDRLLPQINPGLPNVSLHNMVGVEFMTPAVTSANFKELLHGQAPPEQLSEVAIKANNPHIQFFNSDRWGYSVVEFNRSFCKYTAYDIDKSQNNEGVAKNVLRRLMVPVNRIEIKEVYS